MSFPGGENMASIVQKGLPIHFNLQIFCYIEMLRPDERGVGSFAQSMRLMVLDGTSNTHHRSIHIYWNKVGEINLFQFLCSKPGAFGTGFN